MPKSAEELFAAMLELTDPADRAALLDRECVGSPALRAEVESLLAAHEQASHFLENAPAAAVAKTLAATTGLVPPGLGSTPTWECMVRPELSLRNWHVDHGTRPIDDPFHPEFSLFPTRHREARDVHDVT